MVAAPSKPIDIWDSDKRRQIGPGDAADAFGLAEAGALAGMPPA